MHPLLKKALERLGLNSVNDLNTLEQEEFKRWEQALTQSPDITHKDVVNSLKDMFENVLDKLGDEKLTDNEKNFLLSEIKVLKYIIRVVETPKPEYKKIENEINQIGK